jgi:hypothetical protein
MITTPEGWKYAENEEEQAILDREEDYDDEDEDEELQCDICDKIARSGIMRSYGLLILCIRCHSAFAELEQKLKEGKFPIIIEEPKKDS